MAGPDGKLIRERVEADVADLDADKETLSFTDLRAIDDLIGQLARLSRDSPKSDQETRQELSKFLLSIGAATCASFNRSRVIGYLRVGSLGRKDLQRR